jgi:DNA-binding NarL/FixJ family response regulator
MIRVLVVDDHEWVRDGVASVLDVADDMEVVGTGADGHAALEEAERLRPDVITLDVSMPGMDGLRAAELLRLRHPRGRVIMLSAAVSEATVRRARAGGAAGYLVKAGDPDELVAAVRVTAAGGQWWCEQAAAVLRLSP